MNKLLHNLIKTIIVRSNKFWPFSTINRMPYFIALAFVKSLCRKYPQIQSLHLRHGMSEKTWVPGISDIDLTIIISSELTTLERYLFLEKFWKRYRRLRSFFPMLGEAGILPSQDFRLWSKYSIQGYEVRSWKKLLGKKKVASSYEKENNIYQDALCKAVNYYILYCSPKFFTTTDKTFIQKCEIQRLFSRIQKYAYFHKNAPQKKLSYPTIESLMSHALEVLNSVLPEKNWRHHKNHPILQSTSFPSLYKKLQHLEKQIFSVLVLRNEIYIVLSENLNHQAVQQVFTTLKPTLSKISLKPIITTQKIFQYIFCHFTPNRYITLKERKIVFGIDMYLLLQPPSQQSLVEYWQRNISKAIAFPHRELFFFQEDLSKRKLHLKKNLAIQLLIKKKQVVTTKILRQLFLKEHKHIEKIDNLSNYEQYDYFCRTINDFVRINNYATTKV